MATILTVKIEKIIRMTEFDVLRTAPKLGYMYMCLDSMKLYFDQGASIGERTIYDYISVLTVKDLQYNVQPILNNVYYCWEDNSLWVWQNKWVCLYSDTTYPSAYNYDEIPSVSDPALISPIYRYDSPNMPADDNGLLKDGSVVIRDANRLIKGRLYVDDLNDNLVISSYLGGGIRLLPNGKMSTVGEFFIDNVIENNSDNVSVAGLRARFSILNNELYVDYSEQPEADDNEYPNLEHKYLVFHEGNLDTSTIRIMTGEQIYNKLITDNNVPAEMDFNVSQLQGKNATDFAEASHTHTSTSITDLFDVVENKVKIQLRQTFNNMSSAGISSSYNSTTDRLTLVANDFSLTFTGDVTGTGVVSNLTNTSIELTVDPDKHTHQDLIDEIDRIKSICDNLQEQINNLR